MNIIKTLGGQRGLTAIELAIVTATLAILAAIVAVNTTGMNTNGRAAAKSTDIAAVQKAADGYRGQHPSSYYPVSPQSDTLEDNSPIEFGASFTTPEGATKVFVPDFLQHLAKHASDGSWQITPEGTVTNTLPISAY